jgi:hypothetical protein
VQPGAAHPAGVGAWGQPVKSEVGRIPARLARGVGEAKDGPVPISNVDSFDGAT